MSLNPIMPLVHQARRICSQRAAHNPFVTDAVVNRTILALWHAYSRCSNARLSQLLHVEIDRLGMIA